MERLRVPDTSNLNHADGAPLASAPEAARGERAAPPGTPGSSSPQRWHAPRKREVVLRLLRGEPLDAVSREVGVEVYRLEEWRSRALAGMEAGLREREVDRDRSDLAAAKKLIGELSMENELLRYKVEKSSLPLAQRRSRP